jgi:HK97 gp10 family phage protein
VTESAALREMVQRAQQKLSGQVAERIAERARQLAPVDSGRLRDSIHVEATEDGHDVVVGTDYWAPVEFGHHLVAWGHDTGRDVPAQPFMRPALIEGQQR